MTRQLLRYDERRASARASGFDPDTPIAGFYRMRLRSGAVYVGIHIWHGAPLDPVNGEPMDRAACWNARINQAWADLPDVWPRCAGDPISEVEHDYLIATHEWGVRHSPRSPQANPAQRINLLTAPMPF